MKLLEPDAESQLVQRLYARDELAMAFFYKNYKQALYHTIWRVVRRDEIAQDILQETMLKFWLTFPSYDTSKGRLFTWALTIARNLAIDRLRATRRIAQRTQPLGEAEALHLAAPTSFQPEHVGVRDWLTLLKPSDRQLVELLYLQGYTQAEAADELQLPLGTIKSRGRRIIRALARRMS